MVKSSKEEVKTKKPVKKETTKEKTTKKVDNKTSKKTDTKKIEEKAEKQIYIKLFHARVGIGILIEAILLFLVLYFLIMSLFVPHLYLLVEYFMSLVFFMMGYNDLKRDSKSKIGILYFILGSAMLVIMAVR